MEAVGTAGAVIFYGRFYVQWIASELKKRSVVPIAFWYMSSVGSVLLFAYGAYLKSPVGTLSQTFNLVVYVRNLIHIWREHGTLTKRRRIAAYGMVVLVTTTAVLLTAHAWFAEYQRTQSVPQPDAHAAWLWIAVGMLGQGLFALRFLIQWIATELRKKSVIPTVFWQISILASLLQAASFVQRHEWPFAVGLIATVLIYARNLWLIRKGDTEHVIRK